MAFSSVWSSTEVLQATKDILNVPWLINYLDGRNQSKGQLEYIQQFFVTVKEIDRFNTLLGLLNEHNSIRPAVIFCNTLRCATRLASQLHPYNFIATVTVSQ